MTTEPEGVNPQIARAITEAIRGAVLLGNYYERAQVAPAEDPDVVERNAPYRRVLGELAAPENAREAIEELVNFATALLRGWGLATETDLLELLRDIATWPRD